VAVLLVSELMENGVVEVTDRGRPGVPELDSIGGDAEAGPPATGRGLQASTDSSGGHRAGTARCPEPEITAFQMPRITGR